MSTLLNDGVPFGAWGGFPVTTGVGFSNYLNKHGYSNETGILGILPKLDPVQQVKLDINLNMNGINTFPDSNKLLVDNSKEKAKLIPFFQGKIRDPQTIQSLIGVVEYSKKSHEQRASNQLTGSSVWNNTWIQVYNQWLKKLHHTLGEING